MRKNLQFVSLLGVSLMLISTVQSQSDRFAYAVTDLQKEGSMWNTLRKINTQTGEYSDILLNGNDANQVAYDAATKKQFVADPKNGSYMQPAFSTGVAAIAYDKSNNRLYFTPMFIDQLRYVDLKTMKVYYVTDQAFTSKGNMQSDEGKIVTRMVITPDGNGYAITNDGNNFIRFSTGKKLKVTEMGPLVDDPDNSGISVHNRCSSFGGDMVADDAGNLYLISASSHIFKINIETRIAKHIGSVTGLPANYSTNGMVVNEEGMLLVSSAINAKAYYTIDPKNWTATEYKSASGVYRSSDMANSNALSTRMKNNTTEIVTLTPREDLGSNKIQIYPNPVTNNQFVLQFSKLQSGNYSIELTDVIGRQVLQRKVNISGDEQSETINLKPASAKGVYLVKVVDQHSKSVFTQKMIVQ